MKSWFIAVVASIAAVLGIFFYGRNTGRADQQAKQNEEVIESVETGKKSDDYINSLTDAERREWLQKHANSE